MDLTAWFGPHGVFSTGDAAHIFGSGSVSEPLWRLSSPAVVHFAYRLSPDWPGLMPSSGEACFPIVESI
jgi:hypothetical protein